MDKEALNTKNQSYQGYKPRKAVKLSKRDYKLNKRQLSQARKLKGNTDKLKAAKRNYKLSKKVYRTQQQRNGGTRKQKLAKKGYQSTRQVSEAAVAEHDVMGDVAAKRQKIRTSKYTFQKNKQLVKSAAKTGKYLTKSSYHVLNQTYNLSRGRGFTRTLKSDRWETKVAEQVRRLRARVVRTKIAKGANASFKAASWLSSPFRSILTNPLSIKSYLLTFLMVVFAAILMGNPSTMQQDEFSLNESWLHLSKIDREKSNDKVDYWTDIDEMLQYTNYMYEDYSQQDEWEDSEDSLKRNVAKYTPGASKKATSKTMADMEANLWDDLNGNKDDLKKMVDLYGAKSTYKWKLSKDDLAEYKELLAAAKEAGYYLSYQELENIFYTEKDEAYPNPLVITKRFGYSSKKKTYDKSIFKASKGQQLYAAMAGKALVKGKTLIIEASDAKFTYYKVSELRVKTGDQVTAGQAVAKVSAESGQEISYQKLEEKATKDKKAKWTYVNSGFYFASVTYNQTTSVMADLDGNIATKVRAIKDYIKKKYPKATDNAIAAVLGNFATESNINPKRAEGDYLSPPVGASGSSWDDETWLSMGGPAIYNGGYSNIIHRGLGLGQWTDTADGSTRHTLLLNFAKTKNKKWYDLELQLEFMLEGDSPYYINHLKAILSSNDDVETLTKRFLNNWEGNAGDKLLERQNNAKQILAYLNQPSLAGGSGTLASSWNFPEAYRSKISKVPTAAAMTTQPGSGYPPGQCTWYAYNRLVELGSISPSSAYGYLGNGQDWVRSLAAKGWKTSSTPTAGAVVSTAGGFDGTYPQYGHVGIVEYVNPDGSFLVSECNYLGRQDAIHWRVCRPASYYSFATPK